MIHLYTDGACSHNPGPGGWAFAIVENGKVTYQESSGEKETTNNKMELTAIFKGLSFLHQNNKVTESITICTDSAYCLNSLQSWSHNWKKNGWRKSDNKPIENLSLMQDTYRLIYEEKWPITFKKIKAHQKKGTKHFDEFNDLVDHLASKESKTIF